MTAMTEENRNRLVCKFSVNEVKYEVWLVKLIDELRAFNSTDTASYLLFRMDDSSKTGTSIGQGFHSKRDAKLAATEDFEKNFA